MKKQMSKSITDADLIKFFDDLTTYVKKLEKKQTKLMENKQTAVEWLIEQISEKQPNGFYVIDTLEDVKRIFEKAIQMEKEQIKDAYYYDPNTDDVKDDGEQYYNETYGTTK